MFNADTWGKSGRWLMFAILFVSPLITGGCSVIHNCFGLYTDNGERMPMSIDDNELALFIQSVKPVHGQGDNHYQLGRYFQKQGRHAIAVDEFLKALALDDRSVKAFNALGVSNDYLGNYELAMASYNKALALEPHSAHILNNVGYSYYLSGNAIAAIDVLKKALVWSPGNVKFQNNLNRAIALQKNPEQTLEPDEALVDADEISVKTFSVISESSDSRDNDTVPAEAFYENKGRTMTPLRLDNGLYEKEGTGCLQRLLFHDSSYPSGHGRYMDFAHLEPVGKPIDQIGLNDSEKHSCYTLQLGVFSTMWRAQTFVKSIAEKKGLTPLYIIRIQKEKPYYHVHLGRFGTLSEATIAKKTIAPARGVESLPVRQSSSGVIVYSTERDSPLEERFGRTKKQERFTIEVLNGNGIRHMARDVKRCIQAKGFYVKSILNAQHFNYPKTTIFYAPGNYDSACLVSLEFTGIDKHKNLVEDRNLKKDVTILLGKDLIPFTTKIKEGVLKGPA